MRAIPHWMPWQQRQGWVTLRIMSIHHLDAFRYLFGDPLRVFASVRRARVIWVGLDDPAGVLARIAKELDERLSDFFVPETRDLTPHLTLARMNPPRDISEFAPDLVGTPVATDRFVIDRLVLYRSRLSPAGARYEPIEAAALGAR